MAGDDFVMVQLSADGIAAAQGGPLRCSNGRRTFIFTAGVPLRVERSYEWLAVLSKQRTPKGAKLFELAPATAAPPPPAPAPTTAVVAPAAPAQAVEEKK